MLCPSKLELVSVFLLINVFVRDVISNKLQNVCLSIFNYQLHGVSLLCQYKHGRHHVVGKEYELIEVTYLGRWATLHKLWNA